MVVNMDLETFAKRLEALEADRDIRHLISRYAVCCDEHDIAELCDLFTLDAVFGSANKSMVANGREEIRDMFIKTLMTRGPAFHWTHDAVITVDLKQPDQASSVVYAHAETTPNGRVSIAAMKYLDRYQSDGNKWRFSEREIHFLYYIPATDFDKGLSQTDRVWIGGQALPADYPENLKVWQDFEAAYLK